MYSLIWGYFGTRHGTVKSQEQRDNRSFKRRQVRSTQLDYGKGERLGSGQLDDGRERLSSGQLDDGRERLGSGQWMMGGRG